MTWAGKWLGTEKFLHPQSLEADMPCLLTRSSTGSWEPRGTPLVGCEAPPWASVCMCERPSRSDAGPGCGGGVLLYTVTQGSRWPGFAMFSTRSSCVPASADRERRQTETDLGHLCGQVGGGAHCLTHHWPVLIPKDVLNCKGNWKVKHSCVSRKEVKRIW